MGVRPWLAVRKVRTLREAHEAMVRLRPAAGASRREWINFYLRSSAVYLHVASVDLGHQTDAMYWHNREKAKAEELAARPATSGTASSSRQRERRRGKPSETVRMPATLERAHDVLQAVRPVGGAPPERWLAYHRHALAVYAEVSEMDRAHHHEAMYFAGVARAQAAALARQIEDGPVVRVVDDSGQG